MVGESSDHNGSKQSDPMAGIIPRSLGQLFDELRLSNSEFTVRVSYLELYNEELFDLLAPGSGESKLKMYEASKGSSEVKGLEEIRVRSKDEVYQILAQGQDRRRIASTLMNAQSSRSHTVFTIVVKMNIKDNEGEEMVKTGKLNLVDLAGSENISKAGSDNPGRGDRKRECVVINQSLLTLGRVITALVERQPHIPYRESKLTRLLQESLGGRTKTSIIATISPGHKDLEETLSTLEYAHRARNIQNKPEVNMKVLKTTVLNEFVDENDRLRRDLQAAWDKNGVCLSQQSYMELQLQIENQKKEIQEQIMQIKTMKDETERLETDLKDKVDSLRSTEGLLDSVRHALGKTKQQLDTTKSNLSEVKSLYEEQCELTSAHAHTEQRLSEEARLVRAAADAASGDAGNLLSTVAKRRKLEEHNLQCTRAYSTTTSEKCSELRQHFNSQTHSLSDELTTVFNMIDEHLNVSVKNQEENKEQVEKLIKDMETAVTEMISVMTAEETSLSELTCAQRGRLARLLQEQGVAASARLTAWAERLVTCLHDARERDRLATDDIRTIAAQWCVDARGRLCELERAHAAWEGEARAGTERARAAAARQETRRRQQLESMAHAVRAEQKEMQAAKEALERQLNSIMQKNQMFYDNLIELTDMESEKITQDMKIQSELREESLKMATEYRDTVRDKMAALSADIGELSEGVAERAEAAHKNTCDQLLLHQNNIEEETVKATEECKRNSEEASSSVESALSTVYDTISNTLQTTKQHAQKYSSECVSGVTRVCSHAAECLSAGAAASGAQAERVGAARDQLDTLRATVADQLDHIEATREDYLDKQYKSYSPTGKTPARAEYSYPRSFSATSPHERIIARFRASRAAQQQEQETIDLDNSVESSPATGSVRDSDASATPETVFAEPAPPPPSTPRTRSITRCPSDSNLYADKDKENSIRHASSLQKLSKLRQPNSHKKILTPTNRS